MQYPRAAVRGKGNSQVSLKLTGTPWRGPRTLPVCANSASSAFAWARASAKKTRSVGCVSAAGRADESGGRSGIGEMKENPHLRSGSWSSPGRRRRGRGRRRGRRTRSTRRSRCARRSLLLWAEGRRGAEVSARRSRGHTVLGMEGGRRTCRAQVRHRVCAAEVARDAQGVFAARLLPAGDFEVCGGGKGPHGVRQGGRGQRTDWTVDRD